MLQIKPSSPFRILVIADVQEICSLNCKKKELLKKTIQKSSPDLVVLLGDMLFGPMILSKRRMTKIIHSILEPIVNASIPFAFISGNHDLDTIVPLQQQLNTYRSYPECVTPLQEERQCQGGYILDILSTEGVPAFRLLFLESGMTQITLKGIEYLPPTQEQLEYSEQIIMQKGCPPVIVFQHVPVPEIYHLLSEETKNCQTGVYGHGPYRRKIFRLKPLAIGVLGEAPCPAWSNTEQFNGWKRSGNVKAAVFGHDHKNSFVGEMDGITLYQTSCAGLSCYGRNDLRGCRLISLFSDGSIQSQNLFYTDL